MKCPFDGEPLQVVNRSGVEIDWCSTCKGVWLERGELDKLIDQAGALLAPTSPGANALPAPSAAPPHVNPRPADRREYRDDDDDWDERRGHGDHTRPRKRKNLLSEIFDF